jgi:hypothetical protein
MVWRIFIRLFSQFRSHHLTSLITMKYQAQLTPWVVYKMAEGGRVAVIRYRRRNDADAYAYRLSMTQPTHQFLVEFDRNTLPAVPDQGLAAV